jgi:hypothetical protein
MLNRCFKTSLAAAAGVTLLLSAVSNGHALECPPPLTPEQSGALAETPDHLQAMTKLLASSAAEPDMANIVAQVRQWRPDASPAVLANYLISLYCPSVRDTPNLSEAEKTTKVSAFATKVVQSLY